MVRTCRTWLEVVHDLSNNVVFIEWWKYARNNAWFSFRTAAHRTTLEHSPSLSLPLSLWHTLVGQSVLHSCALHVCHRCWQLCSPCVCVRTCVPTYVYICTDGNYVCKQAVWLRNTNPSLFQNGVLNCSITLFLLPALSSPLWCLRHSTIHTHTHTLYMYSVVCYTYVCTHSPSDGQVIAQGLLPGKCDCARSIDNRIHLKHCL